MDLSRKFPVQECPQASPVPIKSPVMCQFAKLPDAKSLLPKLPVAKLPVPSVRAISAKSGAAVCVDISKSDELFRSFLFLNFQLFLFRVVILL